MPQTLKEVLGESNAEALIDLILAAIRGDKSAFKVTAIIFGVRNLFKTSIFRWLGLLLKVTILESTQEHTAWKVGTGNKWTMRLVQQRIGLSHVVVLDEASVENAYVSQNLKGDQAPASVRIKPEGYKDWLDQLEITRLRVMTTNLLAPDAMFHDRDKITEEEARENFAVFAVGVGMGKEELEAMREKGNDIQAAISLRGKEADEEQTRAEILKFLTVRSVRGGERTRPTMLSDWRASAVTATSGAPPPAGGGGGGGSAGASLSDRQRGAIAAEVMLWLPNAAEFSAKGCTFSSDFSNEFIEHARSATTLFADGSLKLSESQVVKLLSRVVIDACGSRGEWRHVTKRQTGGAKREAYHGFSLLSAQEVGTASRK